MAISEAPRSPPQQFLSSRTSSDPPAWILSWTSKRPDPSLSSSKFSSLSSSSNLPPPLQRHSHYHQMHPIHQTYPLQKHLQLRSWEAQIQRRHRRSSSSSTYSSQWLRGCSARIECELQSSSEDPYLKGGGRVLLEVTPLPAGESLKAIDLTELGTLSRIGAYIFVWGSLPQHVAWDMHKQVVQDLQLAGSVGRKRFPQLERDLRVGVEEATGAGSGLVIWAETNTGCVLAGTGLRQGKKKATSVAKGRPRYSLRTCHVRCVWMNSSRTSSLSLWLLPRGVREFSPGHLVCTLKLLCGSPQSSRESPLMLKNLMANVF